MKAVTDHFPNTKVFPAIGNHEAFPVNMFPVNDEAVPQLYDPSWLYNSLADLYHHWLPNPGQQSTLRDSGYYSVSVPLIQIVKDCHPYQSTILSR